MNRRMRFELLAIAAVVALTLLPTSALAQQECFPAPEGLVAWWTADGNGTDVENGNDAVLHGGADFTTGMVHDAFTLNGVDAYVRIPNAPELNPVEQITVGAWFQATGTWTYGNQPIVTKGYPTWEEPYYQYHLGASGGNSSFSFWVSTDAGRKFVPTVADLWSVNTWHFVVGTYDGAVVKVYVDGELEGSGSHEGSMIDYGNNVWIGHLSEGAPSNALFLPIDVDEPFVINRALTGAEIRAIYDAGMAGMCKDEDGDGYRPIADCDETDPAINPDAVELPGNFVDENCDGSLGDCDPCFSWRNHGEYVRCVSHGVEDLVVSGDITEDAGDQLVSSGARSDIGKKGYVPPECN